MRQEGHGDDAQLVVVSHQATDAALSTTVERCAAWTSSGTITSVMRVEGGRRMSQRGVGAHQWRGVIEEYRDWLAIPDDTPTITLREGGTPLVDSRWLSELTGGEVWLKVEGDNPTGSFKDRGMTVALSVAVGQGAEAVVCASTGNTSRLDGRLRRARRGSSRSCWCRRARSPPASSRQAIVHGAQVIMVRGNFDDCLRLSRGLAEKYPVALVNSVNPMRLEGQKTGSFEIVDFLGDAPDVHVLPVGNAGNISAYWKGYVEYAKAGDEHAHAADARLAGGRRRAAGAGAPRCTDPETVASAIRIGNPASWQLAVGRGRRVRRPVPRGHRRARSSPPSAGWPPRTACSSSRRRRPVSRASCRTCAAGESFAGQQVVVTVTGHGLKDIDTALSHASPTSSTPSCEADVDAAAEAAGLR